MTDTLENTSYDDLRDARQTVQQARDESRPLTDEETRKVKRALDAAKMTKIGLGVQVTRLMEEITGLCDTDRLVDVARWIAGHVDESILADSGFFNATPEDE